MALLGFKMKTRTLITLSIAFSTVAANAQIVKPWWNNTQTFSQGQTTANTVTSAATLANGAYVIGGSGAMTNEGQNAVNHGIYRTGANYFKLTTQTTGTRNEEVAQMVNDRFGNLYSVIASSSVGILHEIQVSKINSNGTQGWTSSITSNVGNVAGATTDRDGNVYVLHRNNVNRITKLDAVTGVVQWTWAGYQTNSVQVSKIIADQMGRVYALCNVDSAQQRGVLVFDLDQSNGLDGNGRFYAYANPRARDIAVDSLGRVTIAMTDGETTFDSYLKGIDWSTQQELWSYASQDNLKIFEKIAIDNQSHIVVAGTKLGDESGSLPSDVFVTRFNPQGGQIFDKTTGTLSGNEQLSKLMLDRFGEAYLYASRSSGGLTSQYLTKFSTSGVQRWSQLFSDPNGNLTPQAMTIFDRSGDLLVVGKNSSGLITYQGIQQAPVAVLDGFNVKKETTYNSPRPVVDNDRFPLGISVKLASNVSNGTLHLSHTGHFVYTPTPGFTGTDSFTYKLERVGLTPSVATVMLHVQ